MSINRKKNIRYKILPSSSILAEEIIIGQMLLDSSAKQYIVNNTVSNFFTLQKHKKLYNYISSASDENNITITIKSLWDQKILETIGGVSHIIKIASKSQASSIYSNKYIYTKYCVKILQYHYVRRLFGQYSHSILQLSYFYQISIQQIQKKAISYLEQLCEIRKVKDVVEFRQSVSSLLHKIQASSKQDASITSGFFELDKVTNGFRAGELIIVAGRPSMGKTSFTINIARHAVFELKLSVHIFSLEMSKNEILDKLVALASHVSIRKIQQKTISRYEWAKIQEVCFFLLSSSLRINDQESSSIEYIKAQYSHYSYKKKL